MRPLLLSFLVAATAAVVQAADNPSLNGKWQIHSSISGTEHDSVCTFTQKDDALSGNCTIDSGTVEINGKVAENKVTWSYKSEYSGTPLTVNYDGVLGTATTMKGSVDVPEFGAGGDFTATRSE